MKELKIQFKKTVFGKMVMLFSGVILFVTLLAIFGFSWGNYKLVLNNLDTASQQIDGYLSLLNYGLEQIKSMEYELLNDKDIDKLLKTEEVLGPYEKATTILQICRHLTDIKNSSDLIESVRVYMPTLEIVLSNNGYAAGNFAIFNKEDAQRLEQMPLGYGIQLSYIDDTLILPLFSNPNKSTKSDYFAVAIQLSEGKLQTQYEAAMGHIAAPYALNFCEGRMFITSEMGTLKNELSNMMKKTKKNLQNSHYIEGKPYYLLNRAGSVNSVEISQFISKEDILKPLKPLRMISFAFLLLIFMVFWLSMYVAYQTIQRPIMQLIESFRQVEEGDFSSRLTVGDNNDFAYLYAKYNDMVDKLEWLIYEAYDTEILLQQAEIRQLQSQINPHFLYNSYFMLHRCIKGGDYEKAVIFSKEMGNYFRYITRNAKDMVELKTESAHAQIYANIQAMRFDERILVEYMPLPKTLENVMVPRLILQPLIENSFKHGLEDKEKDGVLRVYFEDNADRILLCIEDNGNNITGAELMELGRRMKESVAFSETTAILNIHKRIRGIFGKNSGLYFSKSPLGGLRSTIAIEKMGGNADDKGFNCR